jgi:YggT family protein
VRAVLCALITAYIVVLFVRIIMSWFPMRPGTGLASVYLVVRDLTEPVLAPIRRVIPPAGMFDLSVLVLSFGLFILRAAVCPG